MTKNLSADANGNRKAEEGVAQSRGRVLDSQHWQGRLDELRAAHHVPGAALALVVDDQIHEFASGVLHMGTGVEATADSVFQLGSVAKIYTATLIMRLVDTGELDLDATVSDILPGFAVADAEAGKMITVRQLLTHTSGLSGDFHYDSGRGDDCLARYVEACTDLKLDCPNGSGLSYSGSGYIILGRIAEVITGLTWDQALRERVLTPLGLEHTMTLPEEALRFRVAMSHLGGAGAYPEPAPVWDFQSRAAAPAARVLATVGDLARFARTHLRGGEENLSPQTVAAMQQRAVDSPDKWTISADGWGLGWTLYDWNGTPGYGHDGSAVGQFSYLRVVPGAGVAIALLTNGGSTRQLYNDLFGELLAELAEVRMPEPFGPAAQPPVVDWTPLIGTYRREGVKLTVTEGRLLYEFVDGMAGISPALDVELAPVTAAVFAGSGAGPSFNDDYMPVVFSTLSDGTACVYVGMRATPKIA
ncbi:beta-lactamase family protein [Nocardia uniformis]|uniref:Beta-lactamase family protein n=1 Tax=Nocardia uniformis TaxID=53432 RepID=A0A849C0S8_9NOCA|nr:serine hydrolase domain-containing protein [Nocardia uniformis]NNH68599.1 beta-lactamase family protein [Nocardia uniformis]